MAIKHKTAYKMAIKALEASKQKHASAASIFYKHPSFVSGKKAAKQISRIDEAMTILATDMERNC